MPLSLVAETIAEKEAKLVYLQEQVDSLNKQILECERKNKRWGAATAVGAAGTVATGVGAIFQGIKLKKMKNSGMSEQEDTANSGK